MSLQCVTTPPESGLSVPWMTALLGRAFPVAADSVAALHRVALPGETLGERLLGDLCVGPGEESPSWWSRGCVV